MCGLVDGRVMTAWVCQTSRMADSDVSRAESGSAARPPIDRPIVAVLPGVALAVLGPWIVTDDGPQLLGWAMLVVGVALLLIGSIAWGVSWGLGLHDEEH